MQGHVASWWKGPGTLVTALVALAALVVVAALALSVPADPPEGAQPIPVGDVAGRDAAADGGPGADGAAASDRPPSDEEAPRAGQDPGAPADGRSGDAREPLTIHHVGDVNLDPGQLHPSVVADPPRAWDGVRETFAGADLVLANLECAATEGGSPQAKQFVFRCDLDQLPAMRDAGVDVVNLANDHTGDLGVPGMVDSLRNVEAAGIVGVGVGENEEQAYRARIVEVGGWRVAILGFGGVVPTPDWTARGERPGQATGYDATRMAEAVASAAEDADLVVVTVHWGTEGAFEPRPEDRVKAEAMIAAGADVVFGHHAHRLQPLERVAGAPVFWNLGNFVWPNRSEEASRTAVATFRVEPDGSTGACLAPFRIDATGVPRPTGDASSCQ